MKKCNLNLVLLLGSLETRPKSQLERLIMELRANMKVLEHV